MNEAKGVIIFNDAKDYYYISYMKDGKMERGFILKSDYKRVRKKLLKFIRYL